MSHISTQQQRDQFKALIRKHVAEVLPEEEWIWLRERASDQIAGVMPRPLVDPTETPEQLIDNNICEDSGESTDQIIAGLCLRATEIGFIDGRPVRYLERTGIYMWDIPAETDSDASSSLSFWISYPSNPPGW